MLKDAPAPTQIAKETRTAKLTLTAGEAATVADSPLIQNLASSTRALVIGGLKRLLRFDTVNGVIVAAAPYARYDRPAGALVSRGDMLGTMYSEPKPAGGTFNTPQVLQGSALLTSARPTRTHQYIPSVARIGSTFFIAYHAENGGTAGSTAENAGSFVCIARATSDAGPFTEVLQIAPVNSATERVAGVQIFADPIDGRLHVIVTYAINGWNGYQAAYHVAIENPLAGSKYFVTTKPKFLCHGLFERPMRWNNQIIADLGHGVQAITSNGGYGWDYPNTPAATIPGAYTCKLSLGPVPYSERFLKAPTSPYPSFTESCTIPKKDGSGWVTIFRTNAATTSIYTASCDNAGNWTTPVPVPGIAASASSRPTMRRLDSGRIVVALCGATGRSNMSAYLFETELTAAPIATLSIETSTYGVTYPEIETNGDAIYVAYDRGRGQVLDGSSNPVQDIRLAKISEASMIAGGGYTVTPATVA